MLHVRSVDGNADGDWIESPKDHIAAGLRRDGLVEGPFHGSCVDNGKREIVNVVEERWNRELDKRRKGG